MWAVLEAASHRIWDLSSERIGAVLRGRLGSKRLIMVLSVYAISVNYSARNLLSIEGLVGPSFVANISSTLANIDWVLMRVALIDRCQNDICHWKFHNKCDSNANWVSSTTVKTKAPPRSPPGDSSPVSRREDRLWGLPSSLACEGMSRTIALLPR